jgi:large subunit ribosomal protein L29
MAEKKKVNFAELSIDELKVRYKTFKEELFNLRFQFATGKLENTAKLVAVRKNIARVMTFMHQAELRETTVSEGYLPPRKNSKRARRVVNATKAVAPLKV